MDKLQDGAFYSMFLVSIQVLEDCILLNFSREKNGSPECIGWVYPSHRPETDRGVLMAALALTNGFPGSCTSILYRGSKQEIGRFFLYCIGKQCLCKVRKTLDGNNFKVVWMGENHENSWNGADHEAAQETCV